MGTGCNYTNTIDQSQAFWIDIEQDHLDSEFELETLKDSLECIFSEKQFKNWNLDLHEMECCNGIHLVKIESTFYGDGLVFNIFAPMSDNVENFANSSHQIRRTFIFLLKNLLPHFHIRMADSAYTSSEVTRV